MKKFIRIVLLTAIVVAITLVALNWAIKPSHTSAYGEIVIERENELPMQEWVLNEAEKAGIDPYKVYMLVHCESRWNPEAIYINKGGSVDRGLFQINNKYHPEVSNSCAWSWKCSTEQAIRIIKERGFGEWTCGVKYGLNR